MTIFRTRRRASDSSGNVQEQAARWVARRQLGLMTPADEAAFKAWRADPANTAAFDDAARAVEDVGEFAFASEIRRMREAALAAKSSTRSAPSAWRVAAAALIALLAVGVWLSLSHESSHSPTSIAQRPTHETPESPTTATSGFRRYSTGVGEQRDIRLDDGSMVVLNTASVLEVAYTKERRDLRLVQGQASFHVVKNNDWPFVVSAGDRRVTAVGTAFDVRLDGERVKVVLVEGRVMVEPIKRRGLARVIPALEREHLEPGQQLIGSPEAVLSIGAADIERATSWQHGQVIFRDDTLQGAVAEMNRYSSTQLVIDDPRIAALKISGVFRTAQPENFVAALTAYYPIAVEQRSPRVALLSLREQ